MDSKDTPLPADWAIEEALRRICDTVPELKYQRWKLEDVKESRNLGWAQSVILAARLIEQHEQPPVDPDVEAVKRIINAYVDYRLSDEGYWHNKSESLTRAVTQYKQEVQNRG